MAEEKRKRILSGIQPTGTPTLGNYIGAVRNWALLQSDYDCLYMVADLHSLTVRQVPADLRRRTRELAALLLAGAASCSQPNSAAESSAPSHSLKDSLLPATPSVGSSSSRVPDNIPSSSQADSSTASGASGQAETNQVVTITFPEGESLTEIFTALEENGVSTFAALTDMAEN